MKNIELMTMLKGLGIILVVFGHSIMANSLPHNFIYLFHLALFYFASGYFFKEKYISNLKLYIWKRVKALYFPFVKYGLLFLFLHNIFYKAGLYNNAFSLSEMAKDAVDVLKFFYFEPLLGIFWFLKSLFVVNVTFAVVLSLCKRFNHYGGACFLFLGGLTILGIVASLKDFPLCNTLAEFVLLPLAALGYIWKMSNRKFRFNAIAFVVSFVILLLCVHVKVEISMHKLFTNPLIFYLVSVCGVYFCLCICSFMNELNVRSVITRIGLHTMPIFVWHLLIFRGVSLIIIQIYGLSMDKLSMHPIIPIDNGIWCLIYTFIGIAIPLLILNLRDKIFSRKIEQKK